MDQTNVIEKTIEYIKEKFKDDSTGHDWHHIYRVWTNAKRLMKDEIEAQRKVNSFIVELGSLLHDIGDYKFHNGDETIGGKLAKEWLTSLNVETDVINQVVEIVDTISYKDQHIDFDSKSIEWKIIWDADKLDALGAIGIARTFAYGGSMGRLIYDPEISPMTAMTKEEYKKNRSPTINHFYEKLLLIKDTLNTASGKTIGESRHKFIVAFLKKFHEEWEGIS